MSSDYTRESVNHTLDAKHLSCAARSTNCRIRIDRKSIIAQVIQEEKVFPNFGSIYWFLQTSSKNVRNFLKA